MEDVLTFIREYSQIYKIERYVTLAVSIITLLVLLAFFGYQIFSHKDAPIEKSTEIINAFVGLGSTGIISVSIGYIFKFMDKAMEAAREFISNRQNN
ncbi:hypothetical protein [Flavobacterium tructae]|uniref:hypothetical protein n=1 Tax=Flavobacterium tructae TaxID=1114873 RepID=UPI0035A8E755